jgi:predicted DNA-binding transcriptional regulator
MQKTERCNSLFALSTSNTLLVNIWIHQLGLFKGSQMAILEIVLELNLKLFRSERPKEIIFVIRDFEKDKENPDNLSKTIYNKVRETWDKIAKPPGTENIKLEDLFHLNAFFLPSFIEEKEEFREKVGEVRDFLFKLGRDKTMTDKNVLVADFPQFLNNVWKTIQEEKDLNLPAEKVLIANMRCNDAKTAAFKLIEENFNTILFKAQTTINEDFGSSLRDLVNQALTFYNKATESYPDEQAKIRDEFTKELEFKIENSFKFQLSILSGKIIKNVI